MLGSTTKGRFDMSEPESDGVTVPMLRNIQIVVAALITGVVVFAVIAIVIRSQNPAPMVQQVPLVSYTAIGFAPLLLLARVVIVPLIAKAGRKRLLASPNLTTQLLMEQYFARAIVGSALLEGAAFFLLVAYLTEGQPWTLAGGLVMAGLLAVMQFPTRQRVEAAIEADRRAIEDERGAA
jgi:hypothetical protein